MIDEEGRYTGEIEFYAAGEMKVEAIVDHARRHQIDLRESYAYSDSVTDLPMLEAVGHPVAVNPDRALLREALERDWEIRVFEHPRPLKDAGQKAATASMVGAAGVTAAIAAGVALWWRTRQAARRSRWRFRRL